MKSHYLTLVHCDVLDINKGLWKIKAPLKVKIFLWYLCHRVVLTRDNLAKRNWHDSKIIAFVTGMRLFCTFSMNVALSVLYGLLYKRLQGCSRLKVYHICLAVGYGALGMT